MKRFKLKFAIIACMLTTVLSAKANDIEVTGELKKWHKVTLTVTGPQASESGTPNPFLNYKLTGVFEKGSQKIYVPGYFAADGNARNTGAKAGNQWKIHFNAPQTGEWTYTIRFRKGNNVAINDNIDAGSAVTGLDNQSGRFTITNTNKSAPDLRAKGRLDYVGEHYLKFAETGEWFLKAGTDSPENLLAYRDFDNTNHNPGLIKDYNPHKSDWKTGDPTWGAGNDKGKGLVGAINYLSSKGINSISFLSMNVNGDDKNVYPWTGYNERYRFDVSKLDQWEVIFSHAETKGMHLHFKLGETENEMLLDNGNLGTTRKLYYREIIARFSHHNALNWNLGEESGRTPWNNHPYQSHAQRKDCFAYIDAIDPYRNNIVIHTAPGLNNMKNVYNALLGNSSKLTGVSMQTGWDDAHNDTKHWVEQSASNGKKWVVAHDEQNSAKVGVPHDNFSGSNKYPNKDGIRKKTLWGNYMANGAGVEYYFGYGKDLDGLGNVPMLMNNSDLTAQDFRTRNKSWEFCKIALDFFNKYIPFWEMKNADGIISTSNGYALSKAGQVYAVYLPNGGSTMVDLAAGNYTVKWYNPRNGGGLVNGSVTRVSGGNNKSIGSAPDNNDWVALVRNVNFTHPGNGVPIDPVAATDVSLSPSAASVEVGKSTALSYSVSPSNATNKNVVWTSNRPSIATVDATGVVSGVGVGTARITVKTEDGNFTASSTITVVPSTGSTVRLQPIHDAYIQGNSGNNNNDLRVENGRRVSYLMFDLGSITGNITNAQLKLSVGSDSGSGVVKVELGDSNNWTEANLRSSNAPSASVKLAELNKTYSIGQTYTWDLDESRITPGEKLSLILSQVSGNDISFASKENSGIKPQLIIDYSASRSVASNTVVVDGLEPLHESAVNVFPNPFTNQLTISINGKHKFSKLKVIDISGNLVYAQNIEGQNNIELNNSEIQNVNCGVYFICLISNNNSKVIKLLKK